MNGWREGWWKIICSLPLRKSPAILAQVQSDAARPGLNGPSPSSTHLKCLRGKDRNATSIFTCLRLLYCKFLIPLCWLNIFHEHMWHCFFPLRLMWPNLAGPPLSLTQPSLPKLYGPRVCLPHLFFWFCVYHCIFCELGVLLTWSFTIILKTINKIKPETISISHNLCQSTWFNSSVWNRICGWLHAWSFCRRWLEQNHVD